VSPTIAADRSRQYVLDANALVGLFEDREVTAAKVERLVQQALREETSLLMSAVNWGEVVYVAWRLHGETAAREVELRMREMPIAAIAADRDRASRAAALKQKHNLSYADAFAAELAIERGGWLVTADPGFAKVGKMLSLYPLPRHEK
jgi:predicted nucleic acid-binding protein